MVTENFDRKEVKLQLEQGKSVLEISFKQGFKACIASVKDKGNFDLAKNLESEYMKL